MKKILLLIYLLVLVGCREEEQTSDSLRNPGGPLLSDTLQVTTNRTVKLMPAARKQVSEWLAYVAAQDEVKSLRGKTGADLVSTANSLMQIMENLKSTLPDSLRTPAIRSRTNVLLTKAKVLNQLASQKEKNPAEIFDIANDLIVEFDNFKLQINEKYLKDPLEFEKELDKEL